MKLTTIASIKISALAAVVFSIAVIPAIAAGLININTASQAELTTLKGIGPVKAQAIIDYREGHPFYSIEDIKQVKGIGDATFAGIKDFITVGDIVAPLKPPVTASAPKKTSVSKSTAPKTSSASSPKSQTAAVAATDVPFQMPALPQEDSLWTSVLGLAALVVVGVGGVLYVRRPGVTLTTQETTPSADEFEIE